MALQVADTSAVGAVAPDLEHALHLSHAQIGALISASLLVAGLVTLPVGVLADRISRPPLLSASIVLWSLGLLGCGLADSFGQLLAMRVLLGAVAATAWPVVASLVGDLFDPAERGRVLGTILSGELLGAGLGFLVSGNIAALLGWRAGFLVLVLPGVALAREIARRLPEPRRAAPTIPPGAPDPARERARMPLPRVVVEVLSIPTNRLLIAGSACGYLFLASEQTFAIEFLRREYHLGQSAATTLFVLLSSGALVGVLAGGRLADWMLRRGRADARPAVAGTSFLICVAAFGVALAMPTLAMAAPAFLVASATQEGPNAPLDSARLDVVVAGLWGRAEGVRTVIRNAAQAAGPILFGLLADRLEGLLGRAGALRATFALMLIPLAAGGMLVLASRRTYADDAARARDDASGDPGNPDRGSDPRSAGNGV